MKFIGAIFSSLLAVFGAVFVFFVGGMVGWTAGVAMAVIGVVAAIAFAEIETATGYQFIHQGDEGEQRIAKRLGKAESAIAKKILPLIGGIFGLPFIGLTVAMAQPLKPESLNAMIFAACMATAIATFIFVGSAIKRDLADRGWWWVRMREKSAVFVVVDGACREVVVNTNDRRQRERIEALVNTPDYAGPRIVLLQPGVGIYFMGIDAFPWRVRVKDPWYERSQDVLNPQLEPFVELDLSERSWNLEPEHDGDGNMIPGGVVPVVGTRDPIDVVAKMFIRAIPVDPYKARFSTGFVGESIVSEITARWRKVVADLKYFPDIEDFTPREGEDHEALMRRMLEQDPQIQAKAHRALMIELGYFHRPADPNAEIEAVPPSRMSPTDYEAGTAAYIIYHIFGFDINDVELRDLNPKKSVWEKMQAKTVAMSEGAAEFAAAKGKAEAAIREAKGEAEAAILKAKGKAEAITIEANAQAQALRVRAAVMQEDGAELILAFDRAVEVAKNADVVIAGTGTDLASALIAAAETLKKQGLLPGQTGPSGASGAAPSGGTPAS